jgi:outer membrane protein assembly factor BamA
MGDGPDGVAVGLTTAGQDLLGYQTILGSAWYGTGFDQGYYHLYYAYGRFTPTLSLQGYGIPVTYGDLFDRGDYTEREDGLVATLSLPVRRLESGLSLVAGYHLRRQRALSDLTGGRFNGLPVFTGRRDSVFGGLDYDDSLSYPWSVSREEGRTLSGRVNVFDRSTGSDLEYREYTLSWTEYLRLHRHHVLTARLSGGMAEGDQPLQQAFQIGGLPSDFNPFGIRGYESRFDTGSYVATGSLEYRFPAWYFLRGLGTMPLFFDRLHGALFVDAGHVWDKNRSFRGSELKVGAGTEIRMDLTVGYWLQITPAIGYAHGFDRDGTDQVYLNLYTNL